MPDLSVWPTDGADGSVSSEARWRKMARYWSPSGVSQGLGPALAAGPAISVEAGKCWLDGHYAELATPQTVPATANGLLVVRFTPADNRAELLYRDGATTPTQTDATWELPIAAMVAGVCGDRRPLALQPPVFPQLTYAAATTNTLITSVAAGGNIIPGTSIALGPGNWWIQGLLDINVTVAGGAGNTVQTWIQMATVAGNAIGAWRGITDCDKVQRATVPVTANAVITVPITAALGCSKGVAAGTVTVLADAGATLIWAQKIS